MLWRFIGILLLCSGIYAQITIQNKKADPYSYLFEGPEQHSVVEYIYQELEQKTKCCGDDAIYLEIKVNKEGKALEVRAITGTNECYKKSIVDIVYPIQWKVNPDEVKDFKIIYLEVKPNRSCEGIENANQYVALDYGYKPPKVPKPEEKKEVIQQDTVQLAQLAQKSDTTAPKSVDTTAAKKDTIPPPLPVSEPKYVSTGDKSPDSSHIKSYTNVPGPTVQEVEYIHGPSAMKVFIKSSLRKQGVCGLVHALTELLVDKDGKVKGYRIIMANSEEVEKALPPVLLALEFKPIPIKTLTYLEIKADIDCKGAVEHKPVDLSKVPNYLKIPEEETQPSMQIPKDQ